MPSPYDRETKAEALALVEAGVTAKGAALRLNLPVRTVQDWASHSRQVAREEEHPAVIDEWYRLTRRTQSKLHDGLDSIEDDQTALKHLSQLTILAGVGTDKVLRDREARHPGPTAPVVVIVTNAQSPRVIEGEATLVEEGVISPAHAPLKAPVSEAPAKPEPSTATGDA